MIIVTVAGSDAAGGADTRERATIVHNNNALYIMSALLRFFDIIFFI